MVSTPDIAHYCEAIAAEFNPKRIILFGSHARGNPQKDSDVDVLVIMPESTRVPRDVAIKIRQNVEADFPVDVLVRSESEVARRIREKDLFMTQIVSHGRVMFEAIDA